MPSQSLALGLIKTAAAQLEDVRMNFGISITSNAYDAVLALVYPQACAVCGGSVESRHDGVVCGGCWDSTRLFSDDDTVCWKCGALSRARVTAEQRKDVRCGHCDADEYSAARACGSYTGGLRAAVLALKRDAHVSRRLLSVISSTQRRAPINQADLIVPVPLHPGRERDRGFNQAAVLAQALARANHLPIDEHSVVRRVHTERHRAGMDARARRESVANAFAVRRPELIAGRQVLLVDDVFTTGATVSECAAALKGAGAKEVLVLTVARV